MRKVALVPRMPTFPDLGGRGSPMDTTEIVNLVVQDGQSLKDREGLSS
jgi:hypothetical protein